MDLINQVTLAPFHQITLPLLQARAEVISTAFEPPTPCSAALRR